MVGGHAITAIVIAGGEVTILGQLDEVEHGWGDQLHDAGDQAGSHLRVGFPLVGVNSNTV